LEGAAEQVPAPLDQRTRNRLRGFAFRLTGDLDFAEEAAQDLPFSRRHDARTVLGRPAAQERGLLRRRARLMPITGRLTSCLTFLQAGTCSLIEGPRSAGSPVVRVESLPPRPCFV